MNDKDTQRIEVTCGHKLASILRIYEAAWGLMEEHDRAAMCVCDGISVTVRADGDSAITVDNNPVTIMPSAVLQLMKIHGWSL